MKYSVLLKPLIMVRIDDIEADSQEEAVKKAADYYDEVAHEVVDRTSTRGGKLNKINYTEHAESELHMEALVDEKDDEEFNNSTWYLFDRMTEKVAVLTHKMSDAIQSLVTKLVEESSDG